MRASVCLSFSRRSELGGGGERGNSAGKKLAAVFTHLTVARRGGPLVWKVVSGGQSGFKRDEESGTRKIIFLFVLILLSRFLGEFEWVYGCFTVRKWKADGRILNWTKNGTKKRFCRIFCKRITISFRIFFLNYGAFKKRKGKERERTIDKTFFEESSKVVIYKVK